LANQKIDILLQAIITDLLFNPVGEILANVQMLVEGPRIYHQGFYEPNFAFENRDKILLGLYYVIQVAYSNGLRNKHYERFFLGLSDRKTRFFGRFSMSAPQRNGW
jgi:hypothetical protein